MADKFDILEAMDEAIRGMTDEYYGPGTLITARRSVAELLKQHSQFQWLLVRALNARTDDTPSALVNDIKAALAAYNY